MCPWHYWDRNIALYSLAKSAILIVIITIINIKNSRLNSREWYFHNNLNSLQYWSDIWLLHFYVSNASTWQLQMSKWIKLPNTITAKADMDEDFASKMIVVNHLATQCTIQLPKKTRKCLVVKLLSLFSFFMPTSQQMCCPLFVFTFDHLDLHVYDAACILSLAD